jgi:hypothetical protein
MAEDDPESKTEPEIPVKWFPWFRIEKAEDGKRWILFGITIRW